MNLFTNVSALDVDECALNTDDCHQFANCTNTIGSFECRCNTGFEGNGVFCRGKKKSQICWNYCSVLFTVSFIVILSSVFLLVRLRSVRLCFRFCTLVLSCVRIRDSLSIPVESKFVFLFMSVLKFISTWCEWRIRLLLWWMWFNIKSLQNVL